MKLLKNNKLFYILLLSSLSFFTFWQSIFFTFWKDDWLLYWGSVYNPQSLFVYILHPGAFGEFYLFSHVFGIKPIIWQVYGIILRICLSYLFSIVIQKITKSPKTGFIAGIFLATSIFGLESIVFASAHIAALALCFFLITLFLFIEWEEKKKPAFLWIVFLLITILLDPGRMLVGLIILGYCHIVLYNHPVGKKMYWYLLGTGILVIPASIWMGYTLRETVAAKGLVVAFHNPSLFIRKVYVVYTYFASIGNIFIGLLYPMGQDVQNTGTYRRIYAVIGFGIAICTIGLWVLAKKKKYAKLHLSLLFLLWPFVFYFPNWLFEPRAPMAGPHRYVMAASLGYLGLLAYWISRIKKPLFLRILVVVIILLGIFQARHILVIEDNFRNKHTVDKLWNQINKEIPSSQQKYYVLVSGDQPILDQAILLSGGLPIAIQRKITNVNYIPRVENFFQLSDMLCRNTSESHSVSPSLENVYAWVIKKPAILINVTDKTRVDIRKYLQMHACTYPLPQ